MYKGATQGTVKKEQMHGSKKNKKEA